MKIKSDNSMEQRFIRAYNKIDAHLNKCCERKFVKTYFTDRVDIAAEKENCIKIFADKLKAYHKLRNAIVHHNDFVAQPHSKVVIDIEHIAEQLCNPMKLIPLFEKSVTTLQSHDSISIALEKMMTDSISQIPILENNNFSGLLTTNTIARWLADNIVEDIISIKDTKINHILGYSEANYEYQFMSKDEDLYCAIECFHKEQENGKRLEAILITETGEENETIIGIMTLFDLPIVHEVILGKASHSV